MFALALTAFSAWTAGPALGAGTAQWQLTMSHVNRFGLGGGVNPLTETAPGANGEGFAKESGANLYRIVVKNVGSETAGASYHVGETLQCQVDLYGEKTKLAYRWLRGGKEIPAASASTYVIAAGDEGPIQCELTVTGTEAVRDVVSEAVVAGTVTHALPKGTATILSLVKGVGKHQKCAFQPREKESEAPAFSYQWLRGGAAISGATTNEYTLSHEDEGNTIQCQLTATNAGGSVATLSNAVVVGSAEPAVPKATAEIPVATVTDMLPAGMTFQGQNEQKENFYPGWNCAFTAISVTCSTSNPLHHDGSGRLNLTGKFEAGIPLVKGLASTKELAPNDAVTGSGFPAGTRIARIASETEIEVTKKPTTSEETMLTFEASYAPIELFVHVGPEAANPSINMASVSGGGAGSASNAPGEGETTVYEAVPFGIASFATQLEDPAGQPFSQAGGHPFGYRTEFTFNYTTNDPQFNYRLTSAGGSSKEVLTELPPGFVGNVQNFPQCPMQEFLGGKENLHCPANTAVGYAEDVAAPADKVINANGRPVILGAKRQGQGEGQFVEELSKASSLIYNLQPSAGEPAEFGLFVIINGRTPVVIDTHVRSGGDYGVTATSFGGSSFDIAELLGAQVRFCENGAKNEPFVSEEPGVGEVNKLSCKTKKEAPPNAKPFLTDPTACAGPAPLTTLRVNSWTEPGSYAAMEGYFNGPPGPDAASHHPPTRGAPVASSFTSGCQSLKFEPTLEFKPSAPAEGGTSQADEPTGITMNLSVPQPNSPSSLGTPALKNLKMTLPAGMTVSPSAADGLQACTKAQFWPAENRGGEPAEHREPAVPAECPPASQVGTAEVFTPLLSGAPAIQGIPRAGEEVTCSEGMWSVPKSDRSPPLGSMSYRWLLNGEPALEERLGGPDHEATGRTYRLPTGSPVSKEDEGKALQCEVTATNAGGSSVAISRDSVVRRPFAKGAWSSTTEYEISEMVEEGGNFYEAIKAGLNHKPSESEGTWWKKIEKAQYEAKSTFKETPTPPPFPPASIPAPSGTPSPGSTLTCGGEEWTGLPLPKSELTHRWLRGGAQIPNAEESTYKLTAADEGKAIQCQVTGDNGHGKTIADSAAVVPATVHSPSPVLPGAPLQGQLFVGQPECSPCTNADAEDGKQLRLFLQLKDPLGAQDPSAGVIVKLAGETRAKATTGQLETIFENQPQQPFEMLQLKLKGGPRGTLATPQSCTTATTTADLTPWSAEGLGGPSGSEVMPGSPPPAKPPNSSFNVDWDGAGGPCPATPPFSPLFNAGTTGPNATAAAASPSFAVSFSREDREQDLSGLQVRMPLGLVGKIAAIAKRCGDAEVAAAENNSGECPPESLIGTATAGAGPGPHPFYQTGKAYLTGPYKGAPFGLAVVTPAVAGPFNLGNVVVRSTINVDEHTAAVTATSDPLPQFKDGVQLRLRKVNVEINRSGFLLNPTNCSPSQVAATLTGLQGTSVQVSSPFGMGGCKNLPFHPELTAEASGQGSKANGTAFTVKVKSSAGQANIGKTFLQLPVALPSRLTTIQKACLAATFEANPASCPEGSNIGMAIAHTPTLKVPLVGPAYLVSHGNAAFPDVEFVLQGEGITLVLDGKTDIKKGITYSRFETVPDAPVDTFETILPAGPHSALTANVPESEHFSLCNTTLVMPTELTGQNGAVIKQTTHIKVTGCAPGVTITSAKVSGNALLVGFKTAGAGTVWVSGFGLHKAHKHEAAGAHQVRVTFTKLGVRKHQHHQKTTVRVKLVVGKQAVTRAMTARL
jgi:hypothetical protein